MRDVIIYRMVLEKPSGEYLTYVGKHEAQYSFQVGQQLFGGIPRTRKGPYRGSGRGRWTNALRKYSTILKSALCVTILAVHVDGAGWEESEQKYISVEQAVEPENCCNLSPGGEGLSQALWAIPEFRDRWRRGMLKREGDPLYVERRRQRLKQLHSDPEIQERRRIAVMRRFIDPEWMARQAEMLRKRAADPAHRDRLSQAITAYYADPLAREAASVSAQKRMQLPGYREALLARLAEREKNTEYTERRRLAFVKLNADPEFQKKSQAGRARLFERDPELKGRIQQAMAKGRRRPEVRARIIASLRAHTSRPEFKTECSVRTFNLYENPEYKKRHNDAMAKLHADPEFRVKLAAILKARAKDPAWIKKNLESRKARAARNREAHEGLLPSEQVLFYAYASPLGSARSFNRYQRQTNGDPRYC